MNAPCAPCVTPWRCARRTNAGRVCPPSPRRTGTQGVSNNGGGPMAQATAGEAVSMSFADTIDNDRFGASNGR